MSRNWQPRTLDELGFVGRGKSRHRPRNDPRLYGGPHPFIQTAEIMAADPYITTYSQTYSEFGLQQSKYWPPNTLCITIAGANTAETAILTFEACFPDSIIGFVPNEKEADLHFVKYSLDLMKTQFRAVTRGATQDNLSLDKLLSFPIPTPPPALQRKIGRMLAAYDDLILINRRRTRLLEAMARSHFRECIGAYPKEVKPEFLVSVPYWRLISENVSPYQGTKRYFATADVEGTVFTGPGISYSFAEKPSRAQKQPKTFSVWFARMKDTFKIAWYSRANQEVADGSILSSGFVGFEAAEPIFFPFLFLTISSHEFHAQKDLLCTGVTQKSLTNESLARIQIPVPAEGLLRQLGARTQDLLHQIVVLQMACDVLSRTRDLLLPRLIAGQWDIQSSS